MSADNDNVAKNIIIRKVDGKKICKGIAKFKQTQKKLNTKNMTFRFFVSSRHFYPKINNIHISWQVY